MIGAQTGVVSTTALFPVGAVHNDVQDREFIYVQAGSGGLSANQAAFIDEAFSAVAMTTSNGTYGGLVGVPSVAIAANSFGWVQTFGNASLNVAASAAADVRLNTTATAGRMDDDATSGAKVIEGVKLNTANGGTAADVSAFLNRPRVGATL
jgi:hypothetical protein